MGRSEVGAFGKSRDELLYCTVPGIMLPKAKKRRQDTQRCSGHRYKYYTVVITCLGVSTEKYGVLP